MFFPGTFDSLKHEKNFHLKFLASCLLWRYFDHHASPYKYMILFGPYHSPPTHTGSRPKVARKILQAGQTRSPWELKKRASSIKNYVFMKQEENGHCLRRIILLYLCICFIIIAIWLLNWKWTDVGRKSKKLKKSNHSWTT